MNKHLKNMKGFTLIELLIVITIIGILAVAFLPSLLGAPAKARDTQRIADLQRIQKVLVNNDLQGGAKPATGCSGTAFTTLATEFGGNVPTPPGNVLTASQGVQGVTGNCPGQYSYVSSPTGYSYGLYTRLESAAQANARCTEIAIGNTDVTPATAPTDADACYVVLTK